jgi:hypothetical protein
MTEFEFVSAFIYSTYLEKFNIRGRLKSYDSKRTDGSY